MMTSANGEPKSKQMRAVFSCSMNQRRQSNKHEPLSVSKVSQFLITLLIFDALLWHILHLILSFAFSGRGCFLN